MRVIAAQGLGGSLPGYGLFWRHRPENPVHTLQLPDTGTQVLLQHLSPQDGALQILGLRPGQSSVLAANLPALAILNVDVQALSSRLDLDGALGQAGDLFPQSFDTPEERLLPFLKNADQRFIFFAQHFLYIIKCLTLPVKI